MVLHKVGSRLNYELNEVKNTNWIWALWCAWAGIVFASIGTFCKKKAVEGAEDLEINEIVKAKKGLLKECFLKNKYNIGCIYSTDRRKNEKTNSNMRHFYLSLNTCRTQLSQGQVEVFRKA
jgi:hypothetical protein